MNEVSRAPRQADARSHDVQLCKVQGCSRDMAVEKPYYKRYSVCAEHLRALELLVDGKIQRFCQQCGKFQDIADFDDVKRSCRKQLARHCLRRRIKLSQPRQQRVQEEEQQQQQAADGSGGSASGARSASPQAADQSPPPVLSPRRKRQPAAARAALQREPEDEEGLPPAPGRSIQGTAGPRGGRAGAEVDGGGGPVSSLDLGPALNQTSRAGGSGRPGGGGRASRRGVRRGSHEDGGEARSQATTSGTRDSGAGFCLDLELPSPDSSQINRPRAPHLNASSAAIGLVSIARASSVASAARGSSSSIPGAVIVAPPTADRVREGDAINVAGARVEWSRGLMAPGGAGLGLSVPVGHEAAAGAGAGRGRLAAAERTLQAVAPADGADGQAGGSVDFAASRVWGRAFGMKGADALVGPAAAGAAPVRGAAEAQASLLPQQYEQQRSPAPPSHEERPPLVPQPRETSPALAPEQQPPAAMPNSGRSARRLAYQASVPDAGLGAASSGAAAANEQILVPAAGTAATAAAGLTMTTTGKRGPERTLVQDVRLENELSAMLDELAAEQEQLDELDRLQRLGSGASGASTGGTGLLPARVSWAAGSGGSTGGLGSGLSSGSDQLPAPAAGQGGILLTMSAPTGLTAAAAANTAAATAAVRTMARMIKPRPAVPAPSPVQPSPAVDTAGGSASGGVLGSLMPSRGQSGHSGSGSALDVYGHGAVDGGLAAAAAGAVTAAAGGCLGMSRNASDQDPAPPSPLQVDDDRQMHCGAPTADPLAGGMKSEQDQEFADPRGPMAPPRPMAMEWARAEAVVDAGSPFRAQMHPPYHQPQHQRQQQLQQQQQQQQRGFSDGGQVLLQSMQAGGVVAGARGRLSSRARLEATYRPAADFPRGAVVRHTAAAGRFEPPDVVGQYSRGDGDPAVGRAWQQPGPSALAGFSGQQHMQPGLSFQLHSTGPEAAAARETALRYPESDQHHHHQHHYPHQPLDRQPDFRSQAAAQQMLPPEDWRAPLAPQVPPASAGHQPLSFPSGGAAPFGAGIAASSGLHAAAGQGRLPSPLFGADAPDAVHAVQSAVAAAAAAGLGLRQALVGILAEDQTSPYRMGYLLQRLSLKLYGCSPADLMPDSRERLQYWLANMSLKMLQLTVRSGCVHLIADVMAPRVAVLGGIGGVGVGRSGGVTRGGGDGSSSGGARAEGPPALLAASEVDRGAVAPGAETLLFHTAAAATAVASVGMADEPGSPLLAAGAAAAAAPPSPPSPETDTGAGTGQPAGATVAASGSPLGLASGTPNNVQGPLGSPDDEDEHDNTYSCTNSRGVVEAIAPTLALSGPSGGRDGSDEDREIGGGGGQAMMGCIDGAGSGGECSGGRGASLQALVRQLLGPLFGRPAAGALEPAGCRLLMQLDEQVVQLTWPDPQRGTSPADDGAPNGASAAPAVSLQLGTPGVCPPEPVALRPVAVVAGQPSWVEVVMSFCPPVVGEASPLPLLHVRYGGTCLWTGSLLTRSQHTGEGTAMRGAAAEQQDENAHADAAVSVPRDGDSSEVVVTVPLAALPSPGLAFVEGSCGDVLGRWAPLLVVPSEAVAEELRDLVDRLGDGGGGGREAGVEPGAAVDKSGSDGSSGGGRSSLDIFLVDLGRLLMLSSAGACLEEAGFTDDWEAYEAFCELRDAVPDAEVVAGRVLRQCVVWKLSECTALATSLFLDLMSMAA